MRSRIDRHPRHIRLVTSRAWDRPRGSSFRKQSHWQGSSGLSDSEPFMVENRVSTEAVWSRLDDLRTQIETALTACVSRENLPTECPHRLRDAMAYSLLAGGKRLRPLLTLLACEACGGGVSSAIPAACALEMVHTYSLVHDDLPAMDDDAVRRGRPTNHKQFDEATAILAGDALLTLAFQTVAESDASADRIASCVGELGRAAGACGMVGGQMADLAEEGRFPVETESPSDLERLEFIHRRKTGALIACALKMGGLIAGADENTLKSLEIYGKSVGHAFQIADDLLDVVGDEVKMGKGVRKDADVGKLTYPVLLGQAESRRRAAALVEDACRAVAPLEPNGGPLTVLARFILERDH